MVRRAGCSEVCALTAQPGRLGPRGNPQRATRYTRVDQAVLINQDGLRSAPRLIAFGGYAGRAGVIDGLRGLGERFLSLGYSTPFLNLGSSYMYTDLPSAKKAVQAVGQGIHANGLGMHRSQIHRNDLCFNRNHKFLMTLHHIL